jgi:arsenate reductase
MKPTFVCYPRCSTCKKAQKWLEEHGIDFEIRHIAEDNPSKKEIKAWSKDSGLPLKRFFNTSGQLYRSLELKDRLGGMSDDEQYDLLASDGMLVKRPILVGPNYVLVGFREEEWAETLL